MSLLTFLALLPALTASAGCDAEAQFIATAAMTSPLDTENCLVKIAPPRYFAASQVCPLDIDTLLRKGLTVPRGSNGACSITVGTEVSGVAVLLDGASAITLD